MLLHSSLTLKKSRCSRNRYSLRMWKWRLPKLTMKSTPILESQFTWMIRNLLLCMACALIILGYLVTAPIMILELISKRLILCSKCNIPLWASFWSQLERAFESTWAGVSKCVLPMKSAMSCSIFTLNLLLRQKEVSPLQMSLREVFHSAVQLLMDISTSMCMWIDYYSQHNWTSTLRWFRLSTLLIYTISISLAISKVSWVETFHLRALSRKWRKLWKR